MFLVFIIFLLSCVARLLFIQFFRSNYLSSIAKKQHSLFVELDPRRGTIYDINLKPQAVNIPVDSVYATPNEINPPEKERIIKELAPILKLSYAYLKGRLYRNKSFIWFARMVSP